MARRPFWEFPVRGVLAGVLAIAATSVSASIIDDMLGDADSALLFGTTPWADGQDWVALGGMENADNRSSAADFLAPFTDIWASMDPVNPAMWTHSYVLDGPVVSATLQLNIAGVGDLIPPFGGPAILEVLVGGSFQHLQTLAFPGQNHTTHVIEGLKVPLEAIDGSTIFKLGSPPPFAGDGYVIDFVKLTIETSNAIPEPATLALLGLGLLGLAWRRRPAPSAAA